MAILVIQKIPKTGSRAFQTSFLSIPELQDSDQANLICRKIDNKIVCINCQCLPGITARGTNNY
jgi:hypothetical protein